MDAQFIKVISTAALTEDNARFMEALNIASRYATAGRGNLDDGIGGIFSSAIRVTYVILNNKDVLDIGFELTSEQKTQLRSFEAVDGWEDEVYFEALAKYPDAETNPSTAPLLLAYMHEYFSTYAAASYIALASGQSASGWTPVGTANYSDYFDAGTIASEGIQPPAASLAELINSIDGMVSVGTLNNDTLTGGSGVTIDGLAGIDTVTYSGNHGSITHNANGTYTVGTDTLANIERLHFANTNVALDLTPTGHAGQAMEFIGTIAPALLNDPAIRGVIISMFDSGSTMEQLCGLALQYNLVSHSTSAELANAVYQNVVGGTPSTDMTNALVGYIDANGQANFLATVAGLHINVDLVGYQATGIEYV